MSEITEIHLNDTDNHLQTSGNWNKTVKNAQFTAVFIPSKRKKTRKINIVLEGEINILTVGEIHTLLDECVLAHEVIDIVLKNITAIDLTAIQLFHFLINKAAGKNITVSVDAQLNKDDNELMKLAGLSQLITKPKLT